MATPKQCKANQANAQKSSGPVSEAGKRISRMNAYKHGLTGQLVLRTPEEQAAYLAYSARLMPDLAPGSNLEVTFAERIISDSWRLDRAAIIERTLFDLSNLEHDAEHAFDTGDQQQDDLFNHAAAFQVKEKTFTSMSLYRARIQRGMHKDIDMLRKLQKDRKAAELETAKQAAKQPRPTLHVIDKAAPRPAVGFVRSAPSEAPAPPPQSPSTNPEYMAA